MRPRSQHKGQQLTEHRFELLKPKRRAPAGVASSGGSLGGRPRSNPDRLLEAFGEAGQKGSRPPVKRSAWVPSAECVRKHQLSLSERNNRSLLTVHQPVMTPEWQELFSLAHEFFGRFGPDLPQLARPWTSYRSTARGTARSLSIRAMSATSASRVLRIFNPEMAASVPK